MLRTSKKDETSYFEEKKLFRLRIGTFEAKNGHFTTSPLLSHNCNVTLRVNENESNSNIDLYEFEIDTGTEPGTVVGQMTLQNEVRKGNRFTKISPFRVRTCRMIR